MSEVLIEVGILKSRVRKPGPKISLAAPRRSGGPDQDAKCLFLHSHFLPFYIKSMSQKVIPQLSPRFIMLIPRQRLGNIE